MANKNIGENEKAKTLSKKELRDLQKKKKRKRKALLGVIAAVVFVGAFIGILFLTGAFDYQPQPTYDVLITVANYGSIHVELYGNDAPETVTHFRSLADSGYYNGKSVFKLLDDLMYMGDENASDPTRGIKGEFSENGFENKVRHERGTLSMARGADPDSAYGQFFIVTKDSPALDGKYAAFGKITSGMDVIDNILRSVTPDENGMIPKDKQPIITSVSGHAPHSH